MNLHPPALLLPRRPARVALTALGLALALLLGASRPATALRVSGRAFDLPVEIEVHDLSGAEAERALGDALSEIDRSAQLLRAIETAAISGQPVALDGRQRLLVEKTLGFCYWSEGGVGPLGGQLYRLLGLRNPVSALPTPDALDVAVSTARCERAQLDSERSTVTVSPGSRLDFFPFELGWAVDQAAERLESHGAANFEIVLGPIRRGAGGGRDGRGWQVVLPTFPSLEGLLEPIFLRDRSLAVFTPGDRVLTIASDRVVPYVDHRRGKSVAGILAVMVVAELATDANGLAYTMFALGPGNGMMLVGNLVPRPSIRWLLGSGESSPVMSDLNWSAVPRH